jgi:hypothetical protein
MSLSRKAITTPMFGTIHLVSASLMGMMIMSLVHDDKINPTVGWFLAGSATVTLILSDPEQVPVKTTAEIIRPLVIIAICLAYLFTGWRCVSVVTLLGAMATRLPPLERFWHGFFTVVSNLFEWYCNSVRLGIVFVALYPFLFRTG